MEKGLTQTRFKGQLLISTAVWDGVLETAISCPHYNEGRFVIVELYTQASEAMIGHHRWVRLLKSSKPQAIIDVSHDNGEDFERVFYKGGRIPVRTHKGH